MCIAKLRAVLPTGSTARPTNKGSSVRPELSGNVIKSAHLPAAESTAKCTRSLPAPERDVCRAVNRGPWPRHRPNTPCCRTGSRACVVSSSPPCCRCRGSIYMDTWLRGIAVRGCAPSASSLLLARSPVRGTRH